MTRWELTATTHRLVLAGALCGLVIGTRVLAAHGENRPAFAGHYIARLGATVDFHHGLPGQDLQIREREAGWVAPADAAVKPNPLANRPETAGGGEKLFGQRCAMCHGKDGRGSLTAPNLTDADVQAQRDGELFWKISKGRVRAGMPTFSFLPPLQRWQLVLHLRKLPKD